MRDLGAYHQHLMLPKSSPVMVRMRGGCRAAWKDKNSNSWQLSYWLIATNERAAMLQPMRELTCCTCLFILQEILTCYYS